jgi:DNA-directed RNA polymerase specialized sigma24 family protein
MTSSFHDTRWTLVSRSRGSDTQASAALSELCEGYYAPVVAFLRRDGREEDAARELAHDFFAKLLAGGAIEGARPERGRFRSYLLGALKHFAADQRDKTLAAKRGGGLDHEEMDDELANAASETPDAEFDRQWALCLLGSALQELEQEMAAEGKTRMFVHLKPWLTGDAEAAGPSSLADDLGMSTDAVRQAVLRLRRRFRALVKKRIADTVEGAAQAEEELQHLMARCAADQDFSRPR